MESGRGAAEKIWLRYYNEALYERGFITEEERNRMAARIERA